MTKVEIEDPDQPEVIAMLAEADEFYAALYPRERNYLLDVAALKRTGGSFYVARTDGLVRGFGAVVHESGEWAEIKRMYVDPRARRQSIGRLILRALEDHARRLGARWLRLETGVKQIEALHLYRSAGFTETGPFGSYVADHISIFMEKVL